MKPAPIKQNPFSLAYVAQKLAFTIIPLARYAAEMGWREDNRRESNGELYRAMANAALCHPVSRQWKGYWQRTA